MFQNHEGPAGSAHRLPVGCLCSRWNSQEPDEEIHDDKGITKVTYPLKQSSWSRCGRSTLKITWLLGFWVRPSWSVVSNRITSKDGLSENDQLKQSMKWYCLYDMDACKAIESRSVFMATLKLTGIQSLLISWPDLTCVPPALRWWRVASARSWSRTWRRAWRWLPWSVAHKRTSWCLRYVRTSCQIVATDSRLRSRSVHLLSFRRRLGRPRSVNSGEDQGYYLIWTVKCFFF